MNVFIVTTENGRVHSVHATIQGAEVERERAIAANEIYATGIDQHAVRGTRDLNGGEL